MPTFVPIAMLAAALSPAGSAAAPVGVAALGAAPTIEGRLTSYPAPYFAPFAPSTALDMAQHVPGFSLDLGNSDVRGFAGTAGNVVINGARPSSKTEPLATVLARIPAKQVVRVTLGPGDLYGTDFSGKPQVLNVVLGSTGGLSGTTTLSLRRIYTGAVIPDGQASLLWKRGASSLTLAAGANRADSVEEGTDRISAYPTSTPIEFRRKVNSIHDRSPYASANWALEQAPDRAIRANVRFSPGKFTIDQTNHVEPVGGPPRDDNLREDYRIRAFELGGDVTRPLAGGAIKLVALATRTKRNLYDGSFVGGRAVPASGFEQAVRSQRNESVGRLNWTREKLAGMRVEIGGEVALNTLDSRVLLNAIGPGGVRTPIPLPIANAFVREKRAEVFVNAGHGVTDRLRVDAGLAYEKSLLTVTGDTRAKRSLGFPKPSVSLDWRVRGGWHLQASLKRTVAQLDFTDFVSTAELTVDRINGGNAELLPQRAWEARATVEHPILGDGLVKLDLGSDRIELLQDRILTSDGFDAPGNIGSGTRQFASLTLDLPLARLGIKGGRLKANGQRQSTRVDDPVSGGSRAFSGNWPKWEWSLDYRQDLGRWAYGANLSDRARITFFRIDEIDSIRNSKSYLTAFVEYRPSKSTTITVDLDNLLDTHGQRLRLFSFPSRAAPPSLFEMRDRDSHRAFKITLKRSVG